MKSAVCLVVKNEQDLIEEWLAYHSIIGFDSLIVFDHASDDNTRRLIDRASSFIDIRADDAPFDRQMPIYEYACRTFVSEFDWIAFIDADEFITMPAGLCVNDFFDGLNNAINAVALPWAIYGSSKHIAAPNGLTTVSYPWRAKKDFGPNRHVKSIVRPNKVKRCVNPHIFEVEGGYHMADGSTPDWEQDGLLKTAPSVFDFRVNHYFTRSFSHWEKRLKRGQMSRIIRTVEEFAKYDLNDVFDPPPFERLSKTFSLMSRFHV